MNVFKLEIDNLETQIIHLENLIEENEEFVYENEFDELNDNLLEKEIELDAMFSNPYDDRMSDNEVEKVNSQIKWFKQLKTRIKSIQEAAGRESEGDLNSMMFPNIDED